MTLSEDASFEFEPTDPRSQVLHKWFQDCERSQLKSINSEISKDIDNNRLKSGRLVAEMHEVIYSDPTYV